MSYRAKLYLNNEKNKTLLTHKKLARIEDYAIKIRVLHSLCV